MTKTKNKNKIRNTIRYSVCVTDNDHLFIACKFGIKKVKGKKEQNGGPLREIRETKKKMDGTANQD
jgi:hypothetical protein